MALDAMGKSNRVNEMQVAVHNFLAFRRGIDATGYIDEFS